MKKNLKIGLGLAMISAISLAAAMPVFADVRPGRIERTGTAAVADSMINIEEQKTAEEAEETAVTWNGNGANEDSADTPDFENSPNFCRLRFNPKKSESKDPEAQPSDYKDAAIRKYAEEYKAKGLYLTDCKYSATTHGSGCGGDSFVFCNGFSAVDDNNGNNTCFIEVVKCSPSEFKWYLTQLDMSTRTMTKEGNREIYKFENQYTDETMTYDPDTEVMVIDIQFKPYARQNGVG